MIARSIYSNLQIYKLKYMRKLSKDTNNIQIFNSEEKLPWMFTKMQTIA